MRNLTREFQALATYKRDRWSPESEALVRKIADAIAGHLNWDTDAGEDWASVIDSQGDATAIIYAQAPLVVCRTAEVAAIELAAPTGVTVIGVDDLDAPCLTAERDTMKALFGEQALSGELAPAHFSANELWFWSI